MEQDQNARVIALGFFDGVHIGHRALLQKAAERAKELRCRSAAITFDRSPREFVTGTPVPLLTTVEERRALICENGAEDVIVAPFDERMMRLPWRDFLAALTKEHGARHLIAGHDYRFGYRNEGTPERLMEYCAAHGIGCDVIARVEKDGVTVSATHIRALLERGAVAEAADFLGYAYTVGGTVRHGRGLGGKELFPTANILPPPQKLLPARGVYAVRAVTEDGTERVGVTNVGVRPTLGGEREVSVETYLPDYAGDLYGQKLRVAFLARLREEKKFASLQELREQIAQDAAQVLSSAE